MADSVPQGDEKPPATETVTAHSLTSIEYVGPYKILRSIGEGGMGQVFVADQTEPVKRRVAVKFIKPGFAKEHTREILGRFEAERQALAMMNHPNIARVLDAGETPDGRPWFAMEYVKGIPLTEYCDEHRLSPDERLDLFMQTCRAIHHAHQKGIIHRDIKPSNVLVTMDDGEPIAKVIDFGLAKALLDQVKLTDRTLLTMHGVPVGTLAYMSPEQAGTNALDVDTRSDVYSLGVILYELLTGTTPIGPSCKDSTLDNVLRLIREEDAPRPSLRLIDSGDAMAGISRQRRINSQSLNAILKGDLDWIALKALEKNRTRRYESASALADDVQRYLSGDPILARPPSAMYQLRKRIRKYKLLAATLVAGLLMSLLLVGFAVNSVKTWQAQRQSDEAVSIATELTENMREVSEEANFLPNGARISTKMLGSLAVSLSKLHEITGDENSLNDATFEATIAILQRETAGTEDKKSDAIIKLKTAEESLTKFITQHPGNSHETVEAHVELGKCRLQRYLAGDTTIQHAREAVEPVNNKGLAKYFLASTFHLEAIDSLHAGRLNDVASQSAEAITLFQNARKIAKQSGTEDSLTIANDAIAGERDARVVKVQGLINEAWRNPGQPDTAKHDNIKDRITAIEQMASQDDVRDELQTQFLLADLHQLRGDLYQEIVAVRRANEIKSDLGHFDNSVASRGEISLRLATLYSAFGDLWQAEYQGLRAQLYAEDTNQPELIAMSQLVLATVNRNGGFLGKMSDNLHTYQKYSPQSNGQNEARYRRLYAELQFLRGKDNAVAEFETAIEMFASANDKLGMAECEIELGDVLRTFDPTKANSLYENAAEKLKSLKSMEARYSHAWFLLTCWNSDHRDADSALKTITELVDLRPRNPKYKSLQALALYMQSAIDMATDSDKAIKELRVANEAAVAAQKMNTLSETKSIVALVAQMLAMQKLGEDSEPYLKQVMAQADRQPGNSQFTTLLRIADEELAMPHTQ